MIRRPPRSTRVRSSAASDVYKRQLGPPPRQTTLARHALTKRSRLRWIALTRETPVEQGFHCFRVFGFWLLQGQWDRGVDEVEGAALGGGGFGQGRHEGCALVVAVAQVDSGQGGEVVQQGGEAAGGLAVGGGLGRSLGVGALGTLGGGDGVGRVGTLLIGERQWRPRGS